MKVEDFCKQFNEVTVSKLHENYRYTFKIIPFEGKQFALIKFVVEKDNTQGFIELTQRDKRNYAKTGKHYEYSALKLFIVSGDFKQYIGENVSAQKSAFVQGAFKKGAYVVFIEVEWSPHRLDAEDIVISAYSSDQIVFDQNIEHIQDPTLSIT